MTPLDAWMRAENIKDRQLAVLVKRDRTTITKLRRGQTRPSWELANLIAALSDGAVPANAYPGGKPEPAT